ncbi:zinc ribbon domain-containing protein [Candidatus Bathyarchaeota archaeon]|nr:zinc ribbon domain-containing protein [Candidatus Bathyarchaeota archaeon]
MRYCSKCGKENRDEAEFCKHCGEKLAQGVTYTKPKGSGWDLAKVLLTVIGAVMIFTALGLVVGGGSLRAVQSNLMDDDGFMMSGVETLSTDSYALVFEDIDIEMDEDARRFSRMFEGLVTFKLDAESNNGKPVFVGVAEYSSVAGYLDDVSYDRFVTLDWEYDPWTSDFPEYVYSHHSGEAPAGPPTMHSFWVAHAMGAAEVLTWELTPGRYWLVVMNEDASSGVDVDFQMGAKVPILKDLGNILLTTGVVIGLIGAALIYYGVVKR